MGTTRYNFHLPFQTEDELRLFLKVSFGVDIPNKAVCPGHTSPWQFFADVYFNRHRVMVLKASRGLGGKTFLLAHLGLVQGLTQRADTTLLGGGGGNVR